MKSDVYAFVKRLCKSFYQQNDLQNRFAENPAEFSVERLCKSFFAEKRLAKPFYGSADYAGGQYNFWKSAGRVSPALQENL